MIDDEYRSRFIARLTELAETEGEMEHDTAGRLAEEEYRKCPRSDMAGMWQEVPEAAAEDTFAEWTYSQRDDNHDY